jgi:DNA-binding CsgD family transcriptional regulator
MDVSTAEISGIIQLVREVCDRWDDPKMWREHLLRGACAILNGNVGTIFDVTEPAVPGKFGTVRPVAIFGLPAIRAELVHDAATTVSNQEPQEISDTFLPGYAKFVTEFDKQSWATASRDQLTDVAVYHASPVYLNLRRHADCDDYLCSMRFVDVPRRIEMFAVDRPHGAAPFGAREILLFKLLHDEIAPLIGVRLATEEHFSRDGLSKRLRETLSLLLDGKSEKEVAVALQLKPGTVHEYITSIYRHFKVSSRAELLAYFVRRMPKLRSSEVD